MGDTLLAIGKLFFLPSLSGLRMRQDLLTEAAVGTDSSLKKLLSLGRYQILRTCTLPNLRL
jgi:hypothetical protein